MTPEPGWVKDQLEVINDQIGFYGYYLEGGESYIPCTGTMSSLLQNIYQLPDVQLFKTLEGTQLVFLVYTLVDPRLA